MVVVVAGGGFREGVAQRFTEKRTTHTHMQPDIKLKRREVQPARQREEEDATQPRAESPLCAS